MLTFWRFANGSYGIFDGGKGRLSDKIFESASNR
jgi:hypothetical protein